MPCFDPDGSLSRFAIAALEAILDAPLNEAEIAEASGRPPDTGRRFARALVNAGLIENVGGRFDLTDLGREILHRHTS
ncbi:MAG: winged helix-turn-helix domain-containing protein [Proteobacteria bacterium]|nr:winged helix-turn-helix domain-containing protein [Pseudomonadota bacterium]